MRSLFLRISLFSPFLLFACIGPLDALGQRASVSQRQEGALDPLADDRIEDKHPTYDPASSVVESIYPDCKATLNKSRSVLRLDVQPFEGERAGLETKIFHDFKDANAAFAADDVVPSMEVVNAELKAFNDGLYAAIELGAETGADGSLVDKRAVLRDLAAELVARSQNGTAAEKPLAAAAAAQIGAALRLGGATEPPGISGIEPLLASFDADPLMSRPIGFYGWSSELGAIFRQDRFLQSPPSTKATFGAHAATAVALAGAPALAGRFEANLDLYAALTNPFRGPSVLDLATLTPSASALDDLDGLESAARSKFPELVATGDCAPAMLAFVPASDSPENRLFRAMGCRPSSSFIDDVVNAVRSGKLDLTPTATSGFYDRQLWALATLLVTDSAPEKDHLLLTKRYKEKLVDTFKAILIESRETHVKQLDIGSKLVSAEAPPPRDYVPAFRAEPFPTFYLRTARAYAFLAPLLRTILGSSFLATAHRVEEGGGRGASSLEDELRTKTSLLYGLASLSAQTLGMKELATAEELGAYPTAIADAEAFLAGWRASSDVARDPRVIVPVSKDEANVRYWAVIGAKVVQVDAGYVPGWEPEFIAGCPFTGTWRTRKPVLFSLESVEVLRPSSAPPLTRDEFRALCNQYDTKADIVSALSK